MKTMRNVLKIPYEDFNPLLFQDEEEKKMHMGLTFTNYTAERRFLASGWVRSPSNQRELFKLNALSFFLDISSFY